MREITVFCYITTTCKVPTFKNKNKIIIKRHFCLSFPHLYLFIFSYKFVITETRTYKIEHDENAMSLLIIQSI